MTSANVPTFSRAERDRRWSLARELMATEHIDALIALKPDACCYNPLWPNIDELARLHNQPYKLWAEKGFITLTPGNSIDYEFIRTAVHSGRPRLS